MLRLAVNARGRRTSSALGWDGLVRTFTTTYPTNMHAKFKCQRQIKFGWKTDKNNNNQRYSYQVSAIPIR